MVVDVRRSMTRAAGVVVVVVVVVVATAAVPLTVADAGLYPDRVTEMVTVDDAELANPDTVTASALRDTEPDEALTL
jgi:hypothetical protein